MSLYRVGLVVSVVVVVIGMGPLAAPSDGEPRAILFSWDGAGYEMTSKLLAEGRLPNLQRMIREGAWSDGMVTSFPTKTAAAHAVLFTGYYGHRSGITGNALLRHPVSEHDRLDMESGYFGNALRVDPIWNLTARAGREAYALHATQAYPFDASLRDLSPEARRHLKLIHGYTGAEHRGEALDEHSAPFIPIRGWAIPEARSACASAATFDVGDASFHALFFDDPLDPTVGCDTLGVVTNADATSFQARVKPGESGSFSVPIRTTIRGSEAWFSIRVFELSEDGTQFLMYRSGAAALALSNPETAGAGLPVMQVFAGNSGSGAYGSGGLGVPIHEGGDGTAEARFLETLAHLQAQLMGQARVVLEQDYGLVVLYSPTTDDVAHELAGVVEPTVEGYDEARAARTWETLAHGFELQDQMLGLALDAASRDDAHVVLVSDHGMAATNRLLHVNVALAESGLLGLHPDKTIDLSTTRAMALPPTDGSIAINTNDRLGGIVLPEERELVLEQVRRALEAIRDPDSGERVVTAMFEPATEGLLQPGGSSTGDLFLDYLPGYYPSASTAGEVVIERMAPRGNHIFVPTRRSMLAILGAWGPRIREGTRWGKTRAIDVVPTVLDLLELAPPADLPGRSLATPRPLLHSR